MCPGTFGYMSPERLMGEPYTTASDIWAFGLSMLAACVGEYPLSAAGHLEVLRWARVHEPPCPWHDQACVAAAGAGHREVLLWLYENGCPLGGAETTAACARAGDLDTLQWLRKEARCPWDATTLFEAAHGGHEQLGAWARAEGCPEPADDY